MQAFEADALAINTLVFIPLHGFKVLSLSLAVFFVVEFPGLGLCHLQ